MQDSTYDWTKLGEQVSNEVGWLGKRKDKAIHSFYALPSFVTEL